MQIHLFRSICLLAMILVLSTAGRVSGAVLTGQNFGGTAGANAYTQATATDASGNVYLAGYFDGLTFTLGSVTLNRIGSSDAFVAKLDALEEALTGAEIRLQDTELAGPITLDKALILKGGWYNTFLTLSGLLTTLNGDLTITNGNSSAETIAVKGKLEVQGGSLLVNGVEVQ